MAGTGAPALAAIEDDTIALESGRLLLALELGILLLLLSPLLRGRRRKVRSLERAAVQRDLPANAAANANARQLFLASRLELAAELVLAMPRGLMRDAGAPLRRAAHAASAVRAGWERGGRGGEVPRLTQLFP